MHRSLVLALAGTFAISGGLGAQGQAPGRGSGDAQIKADEGCPAGMTEIRPRICRPPESPAPSILDYRPHSTLVTPVHMVRAAKYSAIDYHGHPQDLITSADGLARLGAALDSINVRLMVAADNLSGERLQRSVAAIRASAKMKDRFVAPNPCHTANAAPIAPPASPAAD